MPAGVSPEFFYLALGRQARPVTRGEGFSGNRTGTPREVYLPAASPYCLILLPCGSFLRVMLFAGCVTGDSGRPCLVLAGVVVGGMLGFPPEGVGIGGHGPRQGAVAGLDARSRV